jgi:hypothetical protein
LTTSYATGIINCLRRIVPQLNRTAVLLPSYCFDVAKDIFDAAKGIAAEDDQLNHIFDSTEVNKHQKGGGLYFGAVANTAGLEFERVIVAGFLHPVNLAKRNGLDQKNFSIVDPEVYLAVTRCTYHLCVVEQRVHEFVKHFSLRGTGSKCSSDQFSGSAFVDARPAACMIYLPVSIDFSQPLLPEDFDKVNVISLVQSDHAPWPLDPNYLVSNGQRESSGWSGCLNEIRELDMSGVFWRTDARALSEWVGKLDLHKAPHLTHICLTKNRITVLPECIFAIRTLVHLNLANNDMEELPVQIGELVHLQYLDLNRNRLAELPSTIGALKELESLMLWGNQNLRELPSTICGCCCLRQLNASSTGLASLPDQLVQRTGITKISLFCCSMRLDRELVEDLANAGLLELVMHMGQMNITGMGFALSKATGDSSDWISLPEFRALKIKFEPVGECKDCGKTRLLWEMENHWKCSGCKLSGRRGGHRSTGDSRPRSGSTNDRSGSNGLRRPGGRPLGEVGGSFSGREHHHGEGGPDRRESSQDSWRQGGHRSFRSPEKSRDGGHTRTLVQNRRAAPASSAGDSNSALVALLDAKAAYIQDKLRAGLRPAPHQTASFLRELVRALSVFAPSLPQVLGALKTELQRRLGWDVTKNQPLSTAPSPPSAEAVLAFLRRASAYAQTGTFE